MEHQNDVSQLLARWTEGDPEALQRLLPAVYDELHRLAHAQLRGERRDHTLNTTALIHEAYLKLVRLETVAWPSRAHFYALAARVMRHILINYAARRKAQKRGGGLHAVPLDDAVAVAYDRADELLALDEALTQLAALDERQSRVVECRFFGGLSLDETAEALGVSPATVSRDWTMARAWLNRALRDDRL